MGFSLLTIAQTAGQDHKFAVVAPMWVACGIIQVVNVVLTKYTFPLPPWIVQIGVLVLNSVRELRLLGPKNSELPSLSMNHSKIPQRVPLNVK